MTHQSPPPKKELAKDKTLSISLAITFYIVIQLAFFMLASSWSHDI